jgi:hypothetical protein
MFSAKGGVRAPGSFYSLAVELLSLVLQQWGIRVEFNLQTFFAHKMTRKLMLREGPCSQGACLCCARLSVNFAECAHIVQQLCAVHAIGIGGTGCKTGDPLCCSGDESHRNLLSRLSVQVYYT